MVDISYLDLFLPRNEVCHDGAEGSDEQPTTPVSRGASDATRRRPLHGGPRASRKASAIRALRAEGDHGVLRCSVAYCHEMKPFRMTDFRQKFGRPSKIMI